jgi:hypothetical protein
MPENALPFTLKGIPCRTQASKGRVLGRDGFNQQFCHKKRPIPLLTSPWKGEKQNLQ